MIVIKEEKADIFSQTHNSKKLSNLIDKSEVSEDDASIIKVDLSRFGREHFTS